MDINLKHSFETYEIHFVLTAVSTMSKFLVSDYEFHHFQNTLLHIIKSLVNPNILNLAEGILKAYQNFISCNNF